MSGKVLVVKTHIDFPQWVGEEKRLSWEDIIMGGRVWVCCSVGP